MSPNGCDCSRQAGLGGLQELAFPPPDTYSPDRLPPPERYGGRFFQPVYAVPGNEHTVSGGFMPGTEGWIPFAMASGAYWVESNQGRLNPFPGPDWAYSGYRTSVAVAGYARHLAADMYGEHRA
jgi:hypothetical protein